MKLKGMLLSTVAIAVLPLFGGPVTDPAITIDGGAVAIEKWRVLRAAEELMKSRNNMQGLDKDAEQQILKDVFLDLEAGMLAMVEATSRNVQLPNFTRDDLLALKAKSPYRVLGDDIVLTIVIAGNMLGKKLLELDNVYVDARNGNVRDLILGRYRPKHRVEVADYSGWKVNRNRGRLIQDSNYNAIEHELNEDSGGFIKTIYYIHHYTIRYYVLFIRWYVAKAETVAAWAKEKFSETVARWISAAVLYVIPYLFHVLLVFVYARLNERKARFFSALFLGLLLAGVSTILFYFGMSPWSLFVVCVGVPLGIYLAPSIWDSMASGGLHYSGGGSSYTSSGATSSSGSEGKTITTYTDENGTEYKGEGRNPDTIEKQTPGDYAIFDRCIDGSYKERFGDRVVEKGLGVD